MAGRAAQGPLALGITAAPAQSEGRKSVEGRRRPGQRDDLHPRQAVTPGANGINLGRRRSAGQADGRIGEAGGDGQVVMAAGPMTRLATDRMVNRFGAGPVPECAEARRVTRQATANAIARDQRLAQVLLLYAGTRRHARRQRPGGLPIPAVCRHPQHHRPVVIVAADERCQVPARPEGVLDHCSQDATNRCASRREAPPRLDETRGSHQDCPDRARGRRAGGDPAGRRGERRSRRGGWRVRPAPPRGDTRHIVPRRSSGPVPPVTADRRATARPGRAPTPPGSIPFPGDRPDSGARTPRGPARLPAASQQLVAPRPAAEIEARRRRAVVAVAARGPAGPDGRRGRARASARGPAPRRPGRRVPPRQPQ